VAGAEWRRLELISVNTKALDYHSLNDRHFSDCVCGGFAFALLLERDRGRFAFLDTLVSTDRLFARPPRFSVVSCVSASGSAMTFVSHSPVLTVVYMLSVDGGRVKV
jgi:hypothetical protein